MTNPNHSENRRRSPLAPHLSRRGLFGLATLGAPVLALNRARAASWHNIEISGSEPSLAFTMVDTTTGKEVTAEDFLGKVVMLYFGYTNCPDVCPLTLHNITQVLDRLGTNADSVRVLFVSVDPNRDTLPVLKQYTAAFAPQIVGLRGSPDELARLARRYRTAYSVSPTTKTRPYEVTHSSAIYVFGRDGSARLLVPSLGSTTPDLSGTADDLGRLLRGDRDGWFTRLRHLF